MDRESVRSVERAHHGGASDPSVLDFSANVNPRTPPGIESTYGAALAASRRYPDDDYEGFRSAAAGVVDCDPGQAVPTAGGLAALRLAVATTVAPGDSVLVPAPGFAEYAREVRLQGGTPEFREQAAIVEASAVALEDRAAVILCTPNNPTGALPDREQLRALADRCRAAGTTLLVDEAFLGYTDQDSLAGTPGTIVLRSLTKLYGLPGLRAGYAVATDAALDDLATARQAWSLGTPAAAVGERALGARGFVDATKRRVRSERARMRDRLADDYSVHPSSAPFLLLDVGDRGVDDLLGHCRDAGIAIRDARTFRGLDRHVRVAVRRPDENDRLLEVLADA